MIIKQEFETLTSTIGTENINMKVLLNETKDMVANWKDYIVDNETKPNFMLDDTMKFVYSPVTDELRKVDISEFAFSQLCTRLGIPSNYIKKCFDNNKSELAINNFQAWSKEMNKNIFVREYDGVARAILSDSYKVFDSHKVIKTLYNVVDEEIYQPNQVYLSQDKLHIRFVNFEPLPFDDDKLYTGFTVSSSDVGQGSLNMKYFIYRFACKNGIVMSSKGGTLFKQNHIGSEMSSGKLELFNKALINIDNLSLMATKMIRDNRKKMLNQDELKLYLEKAKKELRLSEKSAEKLSDLVNQYGSTRWSVINGVTELSHDFTLDTRLEMESWAGETLMKIA